MPPEPGEGAAAPAIPGEALVIGGRRLRVARLADELDRDICDPRPLIERLRSGRPGRADLFTFIQRIPDVAPKYPYRMEWDNCAALAYGTFANWFDKIIDHQCRKKVRKAAKAGLVVRTAEFDDAFVNGIVAIYNESPVRQGKPFWHYQKPFAEVKRANATRLDRSEFIGAYFQDELIGFIKLVYGDRIARTEQVIAMISHRDKAPTNALLAKAVELCEAKGLPYLTYGAWSTGSLGEFKKANGFVRFDFPRYYVPLSGRGRVCLALGLQKGLKNALPERLRERLAALRRRWHGSRPEPR